jgi:NitT/TauT family transport system permease protein
LTSEWPLSTERSAVPWRWRQLASGTVLPVGFAVAVLLAWEGFTRFFSVPAALLPAPTAIWHSLVSTLPVLLQQAVPTLLEILGGFGAAAVCGIALGAAMVQSRHLKAMLYPNLVLFQLIPKIALAPLFIVWLGIGSESRLAFALFISIFPIIISTVNGLMSVEKDLLRYCASLRATSWQILISVRLPYSLPHIFAGLKIAITMALLGAIVGEFVTAQAGLGYVIIFVTSRIEMPLVMAAIAVLCAIGLVLYGLIGLAERVLGRFFPVR